MPKVSVVFNPEGPSRELVSEIISYLEKKDHAIQKVPLAVSSFRDGELSLRICGSVEGTLCFFIHDSAVPPSEWLNQLLFAADALNASVPQELVVVLPYLRFARQDRRMEMGDVVSIKVIADCLSKYANRGITVDVHNIQLQEYFDFPFYSLPSLSLFAQFIKNRLGKQVTVVSPDAGGGKRAAHLARLLQARGIETTIAFGYKLRDKANSISENFIAGDIKGRDCIIVDDLIDTGSTLAKVAEKLREEGATRIFAYATHGIFSDGMEKFSNIDALFTTNTLPHKELEEISVAPLLGGAMHKLIMQESLSGLVRNL